MHYTSYLLVTYSLTYSLIVLTIMQCLVVSVVHTGMQ